MQWEWFERSKVLFWSSTSITGDDHHHHRFSNLDIVLSSRDPPPLVPRSITILSFVLVGFDVLDHVVHFH